MTTQQRIKNKYIVLIIYEDGSHISQSSVAYTALEAALGCCPSGAQASTVSKVFVMVAQDRPAPEGRTWIQAGIFTKIALRRAQISS